MPGIDSWPCGSSDIWIARAMRSSSSSRRFSSACRIRSSMLVVIWLNDSASSPIWSRATTAILWPKSPWRARSVPVNNWCTDPVIDLASMSPITSAANSMMRNRMASTTRT